MSLQKKRTSAEIAAGLGLSYKDVKDLENVKVILTEEDLVTILNMSDLFGGMPNHEITEIQKQKTEDGSVFVIRSKHKS